MNHAGNLKPMTEKAIPRSGIVGRPRRSDAIGLALACAYAADFSLPSDLAQHLALLDRATTTQDHDVNGLD